MVARRMLIVIVAVVLAIVIVTSVLAVFFLLPRGPSIELWYNSSGHYGDTEPLVAQVLKSQLESAGVFTVNLKSSAWATYTQQFSQGKLPFFLLGWFPDFADSDNYVTPFLTAGGAKSLGSYYNSTPMTRLIANETGGPLSTRAATFGSIQSLLASDVPYIPLWQTRAVAVYDNRASSNVSGVILDPFLFRYYFIGKPGATTLTMSTTDSITNLDPALEYDLFSGTVVGNILDTLYTTAPTNGTTVPATLPLLASGDAVPSTDLKTWTVTLRPGLKFSNGDPITAADVKFSFQRVMAINNPDSASFYFTQLMNRNTIDQDITCSPVDCTGQGVTFHLNQSYTLFPQLLTFSTASIVNKRVFTGPTQNMTGVSVLAGVGSGPYKVDTTTSNTNTRITLVANPNYNFPSFWKAYGGPATVPVTPTFQLNLKSGSTAATAMKQDIQTHAVDLAYRSLNPADVQALQSDTTLKVLLGNSPQIRYLVFNVQTPPFNDVNLRKAIAYLVNRTAIVNTVFPGSLATTLWSMIPPGWFGHTEVYQSVYGSTPNVTQAKTLLQNVKLAIQPADFVAVPARE